MFLLGGGAKEAAGKVNLMLHGVIIHILCDKLSGNVFFLGGGAKENMGKVNLQSR